MKLLKIIAVIFLVYFIRRFFQMYKVVKTLHQNQNDRQDPPGPEANTRTDDPSKVVDADFKVID